jgi:hypothetical protein
VSFVVVNDRLISDDLTTNINALTANVDRGAGNKLFNIALALAAEATAQFVIALSQCLEPSISRIEVAFSTKSLKAECSEYNIAHKRFASSA